MNPHVAIVAFEGISLFHLSVPLMVLGHDRTSIGLPLHSVTLCAERPGLLTSRDGVPLQVAHHLERIRDADLVIVPSWGQPETPAPAALLEPLREAHARGATLIGLCLGAFVLGDAGLLDGQPATTHWGWREMFACRFPTVDFRPDVLYVDNGRVITSAGTAAAIDCCLHLVRRQYGAEVANRLARRMVVPPHRAGGQSQYVEQPVPDRVSDDRLAAALDWARKRLHEPLSVDAIAEAALMSRRTFTRRFRELTGTSANRWITSERLQLAQRLLETTALSVDQIATASGFGSTMSMRQHFATELGVSPSAYRRSFNLIAQQAA